MQKLKNFGFTHKAGMIMPVFSLPSRYGIGSFGKEAYEFVDFLDAAGLAGAAPESHLLRR